jgi:hypothetical protein
MRILSNLNVAGTLDIDTVTNANGDTDRFLVQDANGVVRFRTGAEVAADIGAGQSGTASTVKHFVKLGEAISKGQAVYVSGSNGTNMIVSKASNASETTSSKTLGLLETGGILNDEVYVVTEGLLAGLNTSTANAGDPVWLGTSGDLIFGLLNKPYAPAHLVFIGIVTRVQSQNGEIFVKPQNGFELKEIHDVQITTTPNNNDVLTYESSTGLYKMKTIDAVCGFTPVPTTRTLTINGTSYDLSANRTWSVGTVTSVAALTIGTSGTDITSTVATGTTTPVITINIPTASATNRGALSAADWIIFNNKQNALTNPVTGTGTANQIAYWTSTSEIGALSTTTYPSLTELSYVKGVTSAIQTQLNAKEPTLTKGNLSSGNTAHLTITSGTGVVIGGGTTLTIVPSGIVASGFSLTTNNSSGAATWSSNVLNVPNYTLSGLGGLPLSGGTMTGLLQISNNTSINTTTPGTANYGLHFTGQTTADFAAGITWNGGTGTTGAQAGIYVQGSGSYGTKMYFATTDAYVTGSKTAMSIDQLGVVNFVRAVPTYAGTSLVYNSGTWGINISGVASQVTINYNNDSNSTYQVLWGSGNSVYGTGGVYVNPYNDSFHAYDVYTTGGWFRNHTNNNGIYWSGTGWHLYPKNVNDFYFRSGATEATIQFMASDGTGKNYIHNASDNAIGFLTTGRSWAFRVDNSGNATSYGNFTANGLIRVNANTNLYLDYNYGCSIVGVYSASRYQGVFAMGDAYKLAIDGTSAGNLYGMAWSHPNAGGVAGNLNTHGLLVLENGAFLAAVSGSIRARDDMRAPIFYDSNDTSYYVDPNGTSSLNSLTSGTRARWGQPIRWTNRQAYHGTTEYWTGTNGWGTSEGNWANAWKWGFSGVDIWGENTDHPQGSSYIHAQGIVSGQHYSTSDGSQGYGWMMVGANAATENRYWLRGKWGGTTSGWREMLTSGSYSIYIDAPNRVGYSYYQVATWLQSTGSHFLYAPSSGSGTHWSPATSATYGTWAMEGYRNGYMGVQFNGPIGTPSLMYDSSGNGGLYDHGNGWHFYWNRANTCMAINGSGTNSSFAMRLNNKGLLVTGTAGIAIQINDGGDLMITSQVSGSNSTLYNDYGTLNCTTSFTSAGDITAYSDIRLKDNIKVIESPLDRISKIRGVTFTRVDGDDINRVHSGLIAQEVLDVLPEVVTREGDGYYSVAYGNMAGLFVEAFKEQQSIIMELREEIDYLKSKI